MTHQRADIQVMFVLSVWMMMTCIVILLLMMVMMMALLWRHLYC